MRKDEAIHLGGTARTPEDVVSLHSLGLRFAELPVEDPQKFRNDLHRYQTAKNATGFYYLCHGPREGNPNDLQRLESVYFPKLTEIISLMPVLNMHLLTMHLWLDPRFLKRKIIEYKIDFLNRLTAIARRTGITLCLENLSETTEHWAEVFSSVPLLKMTLDLGHAELLSNQNSSYGFLERYPDRIQHIHLHDNRGGHSPEDDLHLPVGWGIIDFAGIFAAIRAAGYRGTMTLELKPQEIEQCLGHVRRLLQSPRQTKRAAQLRPP